MRYWLFALAWVACAAHAQNPATGEPREGVYTLDRLLALAVDNPLLAAARDRGEAARAAVTSAGAYPNPQLEYLGGTARSRAPGGTAGDARSWTFTQPIDYPWQRASRIEAAKAQYEGVAALNRGTRLDLEATLKTRYYELLRREAELRAATEDHALLAQIRNRVEVRVTTGEAARYELIKADAELLNADKARAGAELRVAQAKSALRQWVGGALPEDFRVSGNLAGEFQIPSLAQLRRHLVERNPELQRARAELKRAERQLTLQKQLRQPALSLVAGTDQDPDMRTSRIGIALTLPLWDRREGPVGEAAAGLSEARHTLEQQEFALLRALEGAYRQYEIASTQVSALERGILRQAEAALRVAEIGRAHV